MEMNNKFGILLVLTIAAVIVLFGVIGENITLKRENTILKTENAKLIGILKRTSMDTLCAQINCTNTTEYRRGIVMLILAGDLQDKKIILLE